MAHEQLRAADVQATADRLVLRIRARFPTRNLTKVAEQLAVVASEAEKTRHPPWWVRPLRIASIVVIAVLVVITVVSLAALVGELVGAGSTLTWLQAVETVVNDVVFVGITVIFLWLLPAHLERRRILAELHRLRSLAHVIDMYQLTKDPERFSAAFRPTAQTIDVGMTPIEMGSMASLTKATVLAMATAPWTSAT